MKTTHNSQAGWPIRHEKAVCNTDQRKRGSKIGQGPRKAEKPGEEKMKRRRRRKGDTGSYSKPRFVETWPWQPGADVSL